MRVMLHFWSKELGVHIQLLFNLHPFLNVSPNTSTALFVHTCFCNSHTYSQTVNSYRLLKGQRNLVKLT